MPVPKGEELREEVCAAFNAAVSQQEGALFSIEPCSMQPVYSGTCVQYAVGASGGQCGTLSVILSDKTMDELAPHLFKSVADQRGRDKHLGEMIRKAARHLFGSISKSQKPVVVGQVVRIGALGERVWRERLQDPGTVRMTLVASSLLVGIEFAEPDDETRR